ncbi:hypothetical protein NKH18_16700 [Streptomyces sp. M10(2022)]
MLDEHVVLEDADLGALAALADDHDPLDGLAARQELGLGDDRDASATLLTAFTAALLLASIRVEPLIDWTSSKPVPSSRSASFCAARGP